MNILYLYNETQTYTNTVFEHVNAFQKYSAHNSFFCHQDQYSNFNVDLSRFDVVVIHYTVRLPYDQVAESTAKALEQYRGLKVLFIQDEYDHTQRAWYWIKRLGIQLVFTVVPPEGITHVYPPAEFPGVRFTSNLTGYVPEGLSVDAALAPPSKRDLIIGYRGRPLPLRYGQLGQEKIGIGQSVKSYCESRAIHSDIAWTEEARIYGPKWYEFMGSCRSMLGSESGSNVFDWDGALAKRIDQFRKENPSATDDAVYRAIVAPLERPGLMNQVSPRIFEAIVSRTVLVLFEGRYSDVVSAGIHFIPLRKDGSNLEEVFSQLQDGQLVDEMAERAYRDIIASGKYSYSKFVSMVDLQIEEAIEALGLRPNRKASASLYYDQAKPTPITTSPVRMILGGEPIANPLLKKLAYAAWARLPEGTRTKLKPSLKVLLKKG